MSDSSPPNNISAIPFLKAFLGHFFPTENPTPSILKNQDVDAPLIQDIFQRIASHYDLMNDVMSGGTHRFWKDDFVSWINPTPQDTILDLASGTGDIALKLRLFVSPSPLVIECDLSHAMLIKSSEKAYDGGDLSLPKRVQASALALPFPDNHFDKVSIAFGLRNIPSLHAALREINRVLKPQGTLFCLEFSHIDWPIFEQLYTLYRTFFIPYLGDIIAHDRDAYTYLVQSIKQFQNQKDLCKTFERALYTNVSFENRLGGLVALHRGSKT